MRLIDADALMRRLCVQCDVESHEATCDPDECFVYNVIVYDAPTIEAEPVRHGRWIMRGGKRYCSYCNKRACVTRDREDFWYTVGTEYCPTCGAIMDGGASNEG